MATPKVYQLIQLLSKTEKRYFSLFAKRTHENSDYYSQLFHILCNMKNYDKAIVFTELGIEENINRMNVDYSYLYNLILSSLRQFDVERLSINRLYAMLSDISILHEKGLLVQAMSLLKVARKEALQIDAYSLMPEIDRWESVLRGIQWKKAEIDTHFEASRRHNRYLKRMQVLNHLFHSLQTIRDKMTILTREELNAELTEVMQHPYIARAADSSRFYLRLRYLQIQTIYHYAINDIPNEYKYTNLLIKHLETNNSFSAQHPGFIISAYNRYIALSREYNPELFSSLLAQFAQTANYIVYNKEHYTAQIWLLCRSLYCVNCIRQKNFKAIYANLAQDDIDFEKHYKGFDDRYLANYSYINAYTCFVLEKHGQAVSYLYRILNDFDEKNTLVTYEYAFLLNILVHFELKNDELLPYLLRNTHRYFKKRQRLGELQVLLLKMFGRLLKANKNEQKLILQDTYQRLLAKPQLLQTANNYFDFLAWFKAKTNKLPFITTFTEKN